MDSEGREGGGDGEKNEYMWVHLIIPNCITELLANHPYRDINTPA